MKKALLKLGGMEAFAKKTLSEIVKKKDDKALVLALVGNLGAGKTTFTQALASILGAKKGVKSPTFVLMKKYPIDWKDKKTLVHIDAYRFEKENEAMSLGLPHVFSDPQNIVVIEWADRIEGLLPPNTHTLYFEFVDEKTRKIQW
jgi:tRNA threonylcarbamoyladenosine biosynthesis protein TsaE